MDKWILDNWDAPKGRSITIKVTSELARVKSRFQEIVVYDTECFGRLMTIDGVIMVTEFDEFSYHEMIAHVPLHVHPKAGKVLVVGGGDGGAVREVLKHDVEKVVLCEIDEEVIRLSKEYLPSMAACLDDSRVEIACRDGAQFIKENKDTYDVIIVDSTDPFGPGEALFRERFYRDMYDALTSDGIVVTQSESIFYDRKTIGSLYSFNKQIYPVVSYYYTSVPTYPSGTIGFSFCSKKYSPLENRRDCTIPGLRYYTSAIHQAAFVLPAFMDQVFTE